MSVYGDTMPRVFNPIDLADHLTDEQQAVYLYWMDFVKEHGHGGVEVEYSNHHPTFLDVRIRVKLPFDK